MITASTDTICAIATPSGRGGVSIIRVSGQASAALATSVLGLLPEPRYAHYGKFFGKDLQVIDVGIALYFKGPDSFTGEDVLELQAHGGPVIVDQLLEFLLSEGCRLARPGEFSERAFLNNKLDLAQAEAIADMIDSHSREAARSALRSLQGEFSARINALVEDIIHLRIYVEASIDFPEEEVDFLSTGAVSEKLQNIQTSLDHIFSQARQGSILKEGLKVVIAGLPNAGKSSLLNALSGQENAIVTDIPGTTRDTLREHILVHGMPLHVVDTAGLRDSTDPVEQEGIRRAWKEIDQADLVLLVRDDSLQDSGELLELVRQRLGSLVKVLVLANKIDKSGRQSAIEQQSNSGLTTIYLSARQNLGIDLLRDHLRERAGLSSSMEGGFLARRRHLDALERAARALDSAAIQLLEARQGELVAEDLKQAQQALNEITGEFTPDDLLGEIFSSFCIGK
jgi:tRNA modification GTPase